MCIRDSNDSAYNLLDTIKQNAEKFSGIAETIGTLRTDYRIIDSFDDFELLAALRTYRDAVVLSAPCSSWATSKAEAFAILKPVSYTHLDVYKRQDYYTSNVTSDYLAVFLYPFVVPHLRRFVHP